jgi:hypothetical protein
MSLLFAAGAVAQNYPMPASNLEPMAICPASVCPKTPDLPTYPYSAPFKFKGRFVDSTLTRDYQTPLRTYRARGAAIAAEHNRVFVMMGSTLAGYDLHSFFSSQLGSALVPVPVTREGLPPEQYLPFQMSVYPERTGSGWSTPVRDGQDRLVDFDWDDRGYIAAAYSVFGFGIVNSSGYLQKQILPTAHGASRIETFKDGSSYYVMVGGGSTTGLYNITNPAAPVTLPLLGFGISQVEKIDDVSGHIVALIDSANALRIYDAHSLVVGNAPRFSVSISNALALSTDGLRFFVLSGTGYQKKLHVFTPANGSWIQNTTSLGGFSAFNINAIPGYLAMGGTESQRMRTSLARITGDTIVTEVEGTSFFQNYYPTTAPAGYAAPDGYTNSHNGTALAVQSGKTYCIVSHHGLGDVFEVDVPLIAKPVFSSATSFVVRPGETLNLQLAASSTNAAPAIRFLYLSAPQGLSLSTDGRLTWSPTGTPRTEKFRVFALDDSGGFAYQDLTLHLLASSSFVSVSGLASSHVAAGGGSAIVNGNGFHAAAQVFVGNTGAQITVATPTAISFVSPQLTPGSLQDVIVRNPDGSYGVLNDALFADFNDVAGENAFRVSVESLVRGGITAGCGSGNYCPDSPISRGAMAVFLLRAKNGSAWAPPPASGAVFGDVSVSDGFAPWIEELANSGVTTGCGGGNYCPTAAVTRDQMAVFLLVTEEGVGYSPVAASGLFGDVPASSAYAKWIEELYRRGVTGGCGGMNYCPSREVTRAQMAVFLKTTFALP